MSHKTALVCGASQGIGEAIAVALAEQGCRIIAMARSREKLEALIARLPLAGHEILAQDIGDRAGLETSLNGVIPRLGAVHILVNNTGGPKPGPIAAASEGEFLEGFGNHILAATLLTRLLLPGMKSAGYGRIINIISTSVKVPIPNLGVSNTIRGAMASWAKTLAGEVAGDGITVNNILPGFTSTPRLATLIRNAATASGQSEDQVAKSWQASVPARRFGQPAEIAAAAAFLASPAAGYINGVNLPVDGGRTGCL